MNYTDHNPTTVQFPAKAPQPASANGNCGSCGSPILFMNVMLCDTCLNERLGELPRTPVAA